MSRTKLRYARATRYVLCARSPLHRGFQPCQLYPCETNIHPLRWSCVLVPDKGNVTLPGSKRWRGRGTRNKVITEVCGNRLVVLVLGFHGHFLGAQTLLFCERAVKLGIATFSCTLRFLGSNSTPTHPTHAYTHMS